MEFAALSRYVPVKGGQIISFAELKGLEPVLLTQELELLNTNENRAYAERLGKDGLLVVPIHRVLGKKNFKNRNSFPRRILFEMTNRCNVLCRMCPQQALTRKREDMSGELYRRVLDEINEHGLDHLALYNIGESLLHPEFKENVRHLEGKENCGSIWISTNGHLFDEDIARFLLDSPVDYINYSLHAVTEETYKTVSPLGNFELVKKNLERFCELKGSHNLPRKPFMRCQMIDQEVTSHEISAFIKENYARCEIVSVNLLEYGYLEHNEYAFNQRQRKPLTICPRIDRNDAFIFSNGEVMPCDSAFNGEISLGNVKEKSLYEIWTGEKRKNLLELNESGRMNKIDFCRTSCTDYDI